MERKRIGLAALGVIFCIISQIIWRWPTYIEPPYIQFVERWPISVFAVVGFALILLAVVGSSLKRAGLVTAAISIIIWITRFAPAPIGVSEDMFCLGGFLFTPLSIIFLASSYRFRFSPGPWYRDAQVLEVFLWGGVTLMFSGVFLIGYANYSFVWEEIRSFIMGGAVILVGLVLSVFSLHKGYWRSK